MCPDANGEQLAVIKEHLRENAQVKYIWFDWSCMPQNVGRKRNHDEELYFRKTLDNVFLLFLGLSVLVVMDQQYVGRFWTVWEAWLSMRGFGGVLGLEAVSDKKLRVIFLLTGNATIDHAKLFRKQWGRMTPQDVYAALARDDILVTNESDKDAQLQVLQALPDRCKIAFMQASAALRSMVRPDGEETWSTEPFDVAAAAPGDKEQ